MGYPRTRASRPVHPRSTGRAAVALPPTRHRTTDGHPEQPLPAPPDAMGRDEPPLLRSRPGPALPSAAGSSRAPVPSHRAPLERRAAGRRRTRVVGGAVGLPVPAASGRRSAASGVGSGTGRSSPRRPTTRRSATPSPAAGRPSWARTSWPRAVGTTAHPRGLRAAIRVLSRDRPVTGVADEPRRPTTSAAAVTSRCPSARPPHRVRTRGRPRHGGSH